MKVGGFTPISLVLFLLGPSLSTHRTQTHLLWPSSYGLQAALLFMQVSHDAAYFKAHMEGVAGAPDAVDCASDVRRKCGGRCVLRVGCKKIKKKPY